MKRLLVVVLAASVLGSMAFAQGLPRGATAWEYATLNRVWGPDGYMHTWRALGAVDGIEGDFATFAPALAGHLGFNFETIQGDFQGGPFVLNLVGLAGWELANYVGFDARGSFEAVFKRPRP